MTHSKSESWSAYGPDDLVPLCERLIPVLAKHVVKRLPLSLREDMRQELVQEGWLASCRYAPTFRADGGATFATFIRRRARGAMLDYLRADRARTGNTRGRLKAIGWTYTVPPTDDCREFRVSPESIERELLGRQCWRAMANEASRDMRVVELSVRGRTLKQVAAAMGFGESRACQLLARGLKQLRERLAA